jgi:hypothetical protein
MFIMKLLLGPEGEGAVILGMSKSTQSCLSPPPPHFEEIWGGGLRGLTVVYMCIYMHVCNVGTVLRLVL